MLRKKKLKVGYPRDGYKKNTHQFKKDWRERWMTYAVEHGVALKDSFESNSHSATTSYRMDILDFNNK